MSMEYSWTMDSDYCDNCGVYLFDGGINDDNSGLCSFCFDQWLSEQADDEYDPDDWYNPMAATGLPPGVPGAPVLPGQNYPPPAPAGAQPGQPASGGQK